MIPESVDSILGGRLTLIQPRDGYRFSLEALLLARFAKPNAGDKVLELGAGCGVVSLIIAALANPSKVAAIELQPRLAEMIKRNAALNRLEKVESICADIRDRAIEGVERSSFDLVIANPPYRSPGAGRESPNQSRRLARAGHLADFVRAASVYARPGAMAVFVFLAARSAELLSGLRANSLEPRRIRFVHPFRDAAATSVLVEARKSAGVDLTVEPPLFVYSEQGRYTEETSRLLDGV
jgi:tRNA1Val (adenine37-N6)-methyltransferase